MKEDLDSFLVPMSDQKSAESGAKFGTLGVKSKKSAKSGAKSEKRAKFGT